MEAPIVSTRTARWRNYVVALLITGLIFATALFVSDFFNARRLADVKATQDNISIDILSLETQFDLLAEHSCRDITEDSVLSTEIRPLAQRLSYLEGQQNVNRDELTQLKRYYSLLQIKDLLLMQEVSQKCGLNPEFILYFYSNEGDCAQCLEQGYALTGLSEKYPALRVYSFDYNLDLAALRTLIEINDVEPALPALVISGRARYGLHTIEDIERMIPELEGMATSTTAR